jgi:nucleotide-binding universal stress UspA family protein
MFETVVLALDGSEQSDRAVPVAAALAKQASGRIVVVHVDERTAIRGGLQPVHLDEEELTEKIKGQAEALVADGREVEVELISTVLGGPAPAIAGVAEEKDADVIVLGSHGNSALAGTLLGSVAHKLLHIAGRPVLVVPAAH